MKRAPWAAVVSVWMPEWYPLRWVIIMALGRPLVPLLWKRYANLFPPSSFLGRSCRFNPSRTRDSMVRYPCTSSTSLSSLSTTTFLGSSTNFNGNSSLSPFPNLTASLNTGSKLSCTMILVICIFLNTHQSSYGVLAGLIPPNTTSDRQHACTTMG